MSEYLVFVATESPCPKGDVTEKLRGFLQGSFGKHACILNDFGTGEQGLCQLFHIMVDNPDINAEAEEAILQGWLGKHGDEWHEEPIPVSGEGDSELRETVAYHYGSLAL